MSISYNKDVRVVFMVKEGVEAPREATEEDFLRAGFVPAAGRGNVNAPETVEPSTAKDAETDEDSASCEDCVFLGEDHYLVELVTLPDLFEGILGPFKNIGMEDVKDTLNDVKDTVSDLFKPLFSFVEEAKVEAEKPSTKAKTSPVEDIAGDLFKGAFSVFNTVKGGLSDLLDSVDSNTPSKPAEEKVAPEPVKEEEVPAEEKPEFTEFEQTIIGKFGEMGLGADAESAMRKSKEFSKLLANKAPTSEEARLLAQMLKSNRFFS